jgi:regulator of cell morphogenesis and NO signaling
MWTTDAVLVKELCRQRPLALRVLSRHGLDAAATATLADAGRDHGRDPAALLAELDDDERRLTAPWLDRPLVELLDHILRTYHRPFGPLLDEVAEALDAVAPIGADHAVWHDLRDRLGQLRADMEDHMAKEERVLFPWLRGRAATAAAPIRAMQLEHADTMDLLHATHAAAARWLGLGPHDGALAAQLDRVERELCEHIHLENNELFPRALEVVDARR